MDSAAWSMTSARAGRRGGSTGSAHEARAGPLRVRPFAVLQPGMNQAHCRAADSARMAMRLPRWRPPFMGRGLALPAQYVRSTCSQLAQHVLQQVTVVGEEARLRTTGSRASAAPPRWRGGRASAHWVHGRVQRPASWRSTYCSRPPWWARRRACEPRVRAPPQRPRAGAGAGLPPIGSTEGFSDLPAGAARTAAGHRGGSTPLPSVSAASPRLRRSSSCHRPWSR